MLGVGVGINNNPCWVCVLAASGRKKYLLGVGVGCHMEKYSLVGVLAEAAGGLVSVISI